MAGKEISGTTKICALIGDPVAHTMSPAMHNAAFIKLGLDYIYVAFQVKPENLKQAVAGLRALHVRGFNVTIPHKVAVIPLLDGLDPTAQKIGAVNTVVNENGALIGYNTDAEGFLRVLLDHDVKLQGKKAVVVGAGGAARAIAYILAREGAVLSILNRKIELDWAGDIAAFIREEFGKAVKVAELSRAPLRAALQGADILINATSVGMSTNAAETPVPDTLLKERLIVFDVVYNPRKTRLLQEAAAAGCRTIGGIEMLAWQGALAFTKWTGQTAPVALMRREAIRILERRED